MNESQKLVFDLDNVYQLSTKSILTRNFKTILSISLAWLCIAIYQYADGYSVLVSGGFIDENYSHWPYIQSILFSVSMGGLIGGSGIVFIWEGWLRKKSALNALIYISISYTLLFLFISVFSIYFFSAPTDQFGQVLTKTYMFNQLFSWQTFPNFMFWLIAVLGTIMVLMIRDKFGPKMFIPFLSGKYFKPHQEKRFFMFLDLKSSTEIAEKLGALSYFNFLNDCFQIATPSIQNTNGQIYQYVGDEIVISWALNRGKDQINCIRCFYGIQYALQKQSDYFLNTYGWQPEFKAGLHVGDVIAGQIGIIKREIVYSGDVLNTTARIQSQCNDLGTNLLISEDAITELHDIDDYLKTIDKGTFLAKGKQLPISVFTVEF